MKSLLFILLLCIGACLGTPEAERVPVASVLRNNTGLHNCNAFFYSKKLLITTATCVSCRTCRYQISVESDFLIGHEKVYEVRHVKIHPNYTHNPEKYNSAKLILKEEVKDAIVLKPAKEPDLITYNGTFYTWRFNDNMVFSMVKNPGIYIHRDLYHRATDLYVQDYQLGIMSTSPVPTGPYDEGTPFIVPAEKDKQLLVYGYFVRPRVQSPGRFFTILSIPHLFHPSSRHFYHN